MAFRNIRWNSLKIVFGVDLRTLALFRMGIGTMLLVDLVLRMRDLSAHYTDAGVFPRQAAIEYLSNWRISLYLANGSFDFQLLMFAIAGLAALLLALGWRTRLMTVLSWLLLMSLHNRNPLLLQGGDNLLLMMLFWGMFLPLGARFSVDAALDSRTAMRDNAYFSVATIALLVQFMSVYFFSAFLKSGPEWLPLGSATFLALNTDVMVTWVGVWARQFPVLLQGLTYFVWFLELLGPLLIFSPLFFIPIRLTLMIFFMLMHLGFLGMLHVGLFPFISILSLSTFTPGAVWDWLGSKLRTAERAGVSIYFDKECGFCLKVCLLLREFALFRSTPIQPAQDNPEIYALMQRHDSWVVSDWDGTPHVRWAAVSLVFRRSFWMWPLGVVLSAGFFRGAGERIYGLVARHRAGLGRLTSGILPLRAQTLPRGPAVNVLAGLFMALIFAHNVGTLQPDGWRLPGLLRSGFSVLRLDQKWNMFAPSPLRASRWVVAEGETVTGTLVPVRSKIDLSLMGPQGDGKRHQFPNDRWRKYAYRIDSEKTVEQARYFAAYLCQQSNVARDAPDKLRRIRLYSEAIVSHLEWASATTWYLDKAARRIELLEYDCPGAEKRVPADE